MPLRRTGSSAEARTSPSIRNARAERAVTRLHEEAEGRDNAPEEAIEAEGRTDHEDHDDDLDRGDDAARPCALKACTVAATALRWLVGPQREPAQHQECESGEGRHPTA